MRFLLLDFSNRMTGITQMPAIPCNGHWAIHADMRALEVILIYKFKAAVHNYSVAVLVFNLQDIILHLAAGRFGLAQMQNLKPFVKHAVYDSALVVKRLRRCNEDYLHGLFCVVTTQVALVFLPSTNVNYRK